MCRYIYNWNNIECDVKEQMNQTKIFCEMSFKKDNKSSKIVEKNTDYIMIYFRTIFNYFSNELAIFFLCAISRYLHYQNINGKVV